MTLVQEHEGICPNMVPFDVYNFGPFLLRDKYFKVKLVILRGHSVIWLGELMLNVTNHTSAANGRQSVWYSATFHKWKGAWSRGSLFIKQLGISGPFRVVETWVVKRLLKKLTCPAVENFSESNERSEMSCELWCIQKDLKYERSFFHYSRSLIFKTSYSGALNDLNPKFLWRINEISS